MRKEPLVHVSLHRVFFSLRHAKHHKKVHTHTPSDCSMNNVYGFHSFFLRIFLQTIFHSLKWSLFCFFFSLWFVCFRCEWCIFSKRSYFVYDVFLFSSFHSSRQTILSGWRQINSYRIDIRYFVCGFIHFSCILCKCLINKYCFWYFWYLVKIDVILNCWHIFPIPLKNASFNCKLVFPCDALLKNPLNQAESAILLHSVNLCENIKVA